MEFNKLNKLFLYLLLNYPDLCNVPSFANVPSRKATAHEEATAGETGLMSDVGGQRSDDKSGSGGLPEEDGCEKDDVDLMWELGRQVDARVARGAGNDGVAVMEDGCLPDRQRKGKTEDVVENILTLSPLANQSCGAEIVAIATGTALHESYSQLAVAR